MPEGIEFASWPESLAAWHRRGEWREVLRRRIFYVDSGGSGPALVLIHGFPTSSFDFHRVFDRLAESFRVIAHDHIGFGFSDKPLDYSYSLLEQAEYAAELWWQLGVRRAHLLAHDYGTSVATELLVRRERAALPIRLDSVTLTNGSIHLELARLRLTQRLLRSRLAGPLLARLVGRRFFARRLRALWGDRARIYSDDLEALWHLLESAGGRAVLPRISGYLDERVRFRERWVGALERLDLPVHVLWGRLDPVAVPAVAEALTEEIPDARLTWLEDVGHFPMLEASDRFGASALSFYAEAGDSA
ncbi:MAG: alpha/beta fold hydrolase [Thermoanaerobaculia bacterium]